MNEVTAAPPSLAADVYWPMMKSAALIAAGELGVFAALREGPMSAEDLARRLAASTDGTERLCAVLTQTGYLVRQPDDHFANSTHAQAWLSQSGDLDLSSGLRWFAHAWGLMTGLGFAVTNGAPKTSLWDLMGRQPEKGVSFAAYMKDHAAGVIEEIQRAVQLPAGATTLLDIGGSHGLHAATFCRRYPELRAVVYDLPVSLQKTREQLALWRLSDRIGCVGGNILQDSIDGTFDVITYFLVAHNQGDGDNARVVQKLGLALNPGGLLAIYEYVRDPISRFTLSTSEAMASAFDLTLLVETGTRIHTADRILAWIKDAGLSDVTRTDLQPADNGSVFVAYKPRLSRSEE